MRLGVQNMALLIGQPIDGRELEQATSPWPPERFALMCDDLAWAASGRNCPNLPSFTTRVNAKDGGIDVEWSIEIPDDARPIPTPILGPGWNVFQYKKRDLIAQDRRRVISNLKSSLTGAVSDLVKNEREKRHPDRYVLFVNIDLKHNDKAALKESILKGYRDRSKLHVEIVGAGELKSLLNGHPHLRAAYFTPLLFKTWQEAHEAHLNQKFIRTGVGLIGREAELDRLRSLVDDRRIRVIVLSGPHDTGKSRLALEATRHRPHDVVQALDPRSMDLSDYRNLCASHGEAICIVEDPEPDSIQSLVNEALGLPNLKLIITLPTPADAPLPSYGYDERVQSMDLHPLTEEKARKLLKSSGYPLDFEVEDWIIRHAGGIPGVLLAAASVGDKLRLELTNFVEAVGREFEKRIQTELGPDALKCARLFSTLTHVGISGKSEAELKHICDLFGEGWKPHTALLSLADLERAGLARRGGSFAEITLPIFANYLAAQLLQGRLDEIFALFGRLDNAGRVRFIKRLSEVKSEEVERFWDEVFATDGLFKDFQATLSNMHLLRLIAGTVPDRVLRLLESGLRNSSKEERLAIRGDQRRELMWTLEQLLFRAKTSRGALRLVWLLAEAENENYGNNATGILAACFHPLHPQMPLPLRDRLELLREFIAENASKESKLVVIQAVRAALSQTGAFPLLHGMGVAPLDSRPGFKYQDFYDYCRDLVDVLISISTEGNDVAATALSELPRLIAELGIQARPEDALERFSTLADWACSGKVGLDVSSLVDALCWMRDVLSERLDKPQFPSNYRGKFQAYVGELKRLRTALETTSFATRLRRWAGREVFDDHGDDLKAGGSPRFERELMKLAGEAIENPDLLHADLMEWLLSPSSQRSHVFFFFLGRSDDTLIFRERIESLAQRSDGASAFAAYWGGWAKRDPEVAEKWLDQLVTSNTVTGEAIVQATGWLGASQAAIDRVRGQIETGHIHPDYVARVLGGGRFLKQLTEDQFEQLLKAIAGETFEHGAAAVDMLRMWILLDKPVQGTLADFAWRCLEQAPAVEPPAISWEFDQLAAELTQDDPERGFIFLERAIERYEDERKRWDYLDPDEGRRFLKALQSSDRKRVISILLNAARTDVRMRFRLSWLLRELVDQERDQEILLSFAKDDIENARFIAACITTAKPGFWPIASELVQKHPHDDKLLANLTSGLEQEGSVISGSMSQFYQALRGEVEQILSEPSTPLAVKAWLREVRGRLEREVSSQIIWEYDEDVNDLRRYIQDKGSTQRMWAIGRILKYSKWEDIKRLLTVEDIEEALPQIDLPEKKRKMLEKALEVWRHGE
jgi:hypothetical protein